MKDKTKEELEKHRPVVDAIIAVNFCLNELYHDQDKSVNDIFAGNCTYEELIGALLKARDELSN